MKRARSAFLALGIFALHCSSSDGTDTPGTTDGGTGTDAGVDAAVTVDAGGVRPKDTTPPTFGGAKAATATGDTSVVISWNSASDDTSSASRIAYRVFLAKGDGTYDYGSPVHVSPAGATTATVLALRPLSENTFVVRAVDEAGNMDANTAAVTATTTDSLPPRFRGILDAKGKGAHEIEVTWNRAVDDGTAAADLRYAIFASTTPGGQDFDNPSVTTSAGVTHAILQGLAEAKQYFVVVRAVDAAGNLDANRVEKAASTIDGTAPTFDGVGSVTANGIAMRLEWPPASDAITHASDLVYDVYQATGTTPFDYSRPTFTTAKGVTSATFGDLATTTTYRYVVRARDAAGTRDTNTAEKSATTASSSDVTAPTFGGLTSIESVSASSVRLHWNAGTDDTTAAAALVYDVYLASSSGAQVYTAATYSSTPGATSLDVTGLAPQTTVYAVVRARDLAGNHDTNTTERSGASAPDSTKPTFGGIVSANATSTTSITLGWNAAADDVTLPASMRYRIYAAPSANAQVFTTPLATTTPGATSFVVASLLAEKTYWFVVRAVDAADNESENLEELSATTLPDTQAPTFGGVQTASASTPDQVIVTWSTATDNVTPNAGIVYLPYIATTSGGQNFASTPTPTAPNALAYAFTGLAPNTDYWVVVRARDAKGNVDTNTVERMAHTPPDTSRPTFNGGTNVSGVTSTSITLGWLPGTDNVTSAPNLTYRICMSETQGACKDGGFTTTKSVVGLTSTTFTSLQPTHTYYFVVRVADQANNESSPPDVEVSGITVQESTPPTFAGVASSTAVSHKRVDLGWQAATDNFSGPTQITYSAWVATTSGGQNFAGAPALANQPGVAGANTGTITGLSPNTTYYFVVRARDAAGNTETNTVEATVTTPSDNEGPTFGGITSDTMFTYSSYRLNWSPASDDVTPAGNLVYDVCMGTLSTTCTDAFAANIVASTSPGASSYTVMGLPPNSTRYFLVRARDAAGNRSANATVYPITTGSDNVAPTSPVGTAAARVGGDATALAVTFGTGSDDFTATNMLRYQYCVSTTTCTPTTTSTGGATSANVTGLSPFTAYNVFVRTVDAAGNSSNAVSVSATTGTSFATNVSGALTTKCSSSTCHNGGNGTGGPFGVRANIVNVATVSTCVGNTLVVPGSSATSMLWRKINPSPPCGGLMPFGPPLTANELTAIQTWIDQGALDN
ncbi:MAG: hypothetical protein U0169_13130 [Polyangiaceae bacterium]